MSNDILSDWDNFDLNDDGDVIKVNNSINHNDGVISESPFDDFIEYEIVYENTGITTIDGIQFASNGEKILNDTIPNDLCPVKECMIIDNNMPEFVEIPDLCFCPSIVDEVKELGTKTVVVLKHTDNMVFSIDEFLTKKNCGS